MTPVFVPKPLLAQIIRGTALQYGNFALKSGKRSHFYLDLRITHLSPALAVVVNAINYELQGFEFDAIGGPCIGADPIVGGYIYALAAHKPNLRGYLVRKEQKGHGKDGLVVGSVKPGDKCIMIEDVATTGKSMMDAIKHVENFGAHVIMGIAVVDRSNGKAAELLNRSGVGYKSLLTLEDLNIDQSPHYDETKNKIWRFNLCQGNDEQGRMFGYVYGEDGGFFFTWLKDLESTLASVEADEYGDGGLSKKDVVEFLREFLPTRTLGQMMGYK